ncbi:MAG TPA: hypothetical protein VFV42_07820 [Acidimicrobiales bacterium]|nr:hypothetical protein [Acidimicrobiales bacterium]
MATIEVGEREVRVRLQPIERFFSLRGDVTFPREAVASVTVFERGLDAVHGIRAPGLGAPGVRAVGIWRRRNGKELVVAKRGQPAVRIELRDEPWGAVVIGADDPEAVAAALR